MSLKYLNLSGLEDLWINIKNYILSKIPTKTSELTNDSGYLTSHQSLDNYVTLNSNQTITAIKVITGGNQGKMLFKNPNYTKGDAVESGVTVSRIYFGNGTSYGAANGVLTTDINSAGNTSMELCAMNNTASNSNRASLILTYDKSATRPRMLKSWGDFIPFSDNNYTLGNTSNIWKECYSNAYYLGSTAFGDIVTHNASEFLTSHQSLSNYVTLDGTQTIAGTKTFSSTISGSISGNASTADKVWATIAADTTTALVQATVASNDCFRIAAGGAANAGWAEIATGDDANEPIYVRQYKGAFTTLQRTATLLDGSGNTSFPGTVTATGFSGPLTGDVTGTASKATSDANGREIATGYMWRGSYERIVGTSEEHKDLNTYQDAGFYNVKTALVDNCPSGIGVDAVLLVYPWDHGNYPTQEITEAAASSNARRWVRKCNNGTWSDWKRIAFTTDDISGTAAKATGNANGNEITDTVIKGLSISGKTITYTKIDGNTGTLTTQDTVYTHPTTSGNKHIPSGGSSGQFLGWDSDGTAKWVNNPNTNTDTLMTQNVSTTNATYPVLLVATADATANQGAKTGIFAKSVKVNPSTNVISASGFSGNLTGNVTGNCSGSSGSCTGNAATATQFSANTTVALTGDATGTSAGSKKGWSIPVTLANSGVTAGDYGPSADASPAHSGTFTVPSITVDAKGRITAASTKTITLPSDNNTDTKVTQTVTTANSNYPVLLCATADATATGTTTSRFSAGLTVNTRYSSISMTNKYDTANTKGVRNTASYSNGILYFRSYDNTQMGLIRCDSHKSGYQHIYMQASNYIKNGAINPEGTATTCSIAVRVRDNGSKTVYTEGSWENSLTPYANETYNIGTSSLRWMNCYCKNFYGSYVDIAGRYIGNEYSTNARTCLYLKSNRDTDGKSGIYFSKFRQNRAQGALTGSDLVDLSLDVLENSVRTNSCISISFRYFENDVPTKIYVKPKASATSYMGTADSPWTNAYTKNINNLEPSSLSLPNPSNSIDISAYFTHTGTGETNVYAVPSNGWIFLYLATISSCEAKVLDAAQNVLWGTSAHNFREMLMIPVVTGSTLQTYWETAYSTVNVSIARFIPCQGNV